MQIEGAIVGPQVPELHRAWVELLPDLKHAKFVVDLREVTHVDAGGRELLAEIHAQSGADFLADTPLTKYFADEARDGKRSSSDSKPNQRRQP